MIRFFLLIFGDLFETDDPIFELVSILVELSNNITAFHFDAENIAYLSTLISDFLFTCHSSLPSLKMSIKFHHLTHYPRIIEKFGPLRFFNTMNFESHHSFLKSLMKPSNNWKCPAYTIANKYARFSTLQGSGQEETPRALSLSQIDAEEIYGQFSIESEPGPFFSKVSLGGVLYQIENVIFYKRIGDDDFFLKIRYITLSNGTYIFCGKISKGYHHHDKNIVELEELDFARTLRYPQLSLDKHCYNVYSIDNFDYIALYNRF